MKAPTKQRSMKETNGADSRVDLRRKRVAIAQAHARTETIKRVLGGESISFGMVWAHAKEICSQDRTWCEFVGFRVAVDKPG